MSKRPDTHEGELKSRPSVRSLMIGVAVPIYVIFAAGAISYIGFARNYRFRQLDSVILPHGRIGMVGFCLAGDL